MQLLPATPVDTITNAHISFCSYLGSTRRFHLFVLIFKNIVKASNKLRLIKITSLAHGLSQKRSAGQKSNKWRAEEIKFADHEKE